jgi:DNA-binding CsgD family transcriptional regulator
MTMASKRTRSAGDPPGPDEPRISTFHVGESLFAVLSVPLEEGSSLSALTDAERSVATLAAAGLGNAAIARCRGTSERTVANQMAGIFRKLKVSSRYELASLLALSALGKGEP